MYGLDEEEYLIPDYVEMQEVAEKFSFKDYMKLRDYLINEIRTKNR